MGNREMLRGEQVQNNALSVRLPFAGITLFRFYGCDLSLTMLRALQLVKHPGIVPQM
jgi:hypothetical protein